MSMRERFFAAVVFALGASIATAAETPRFGQPITEADVAPWDISIGPDGAGLPPGNGTPAQGAAVYAAHGCAACHGEQGKGGSAGPLAGGGSLTATDRAPQKLIGNYWPYATTIFDFVRRAMPWQQPKTLTNDEVYALTAYILAQNKLIDPSEVINAQSLPKVQMPNRNGFIPRFPERMPPG
jgi:S-disulfanyl-L-cysteine oxidoreductase SoxD